MSIGGLTILQWYLLVPFDVFEIWFIVFIPATTIRSLVFFVLRERVFGGI